MLKACQSPHCSSSAPISPHHSLLFSTCSTTALFGKPSCIIFGLYRIEDERILDLWFKTMPVPSLGQNQGLYRNSRPYAWSLQYLVSWSGATGVISDRYTPPQNSQRSSAEGRYLPSSATTPNPPCSVNRYNSLASKHLRHWCGISTHEVSYVTVWLRAV